ncbi:MAG: hemerythrin family protein [Deltaproteobacteria bacterium]|nr:hemerythrin family protein [Deltaproteobacteria bacterium]
MAEIEWDNSLCIGHSEIDAQHRSWLELINRLHSEMIHRPDTGNLNAACKGAIEEMKSYCERHFRLEEDLMRELDYFDCARHIQLHRDFVTRLNQIEATMCHGSSTGTHSAMTDIFKAMGDWLVNHIMNEDMKIGFSQLSSGSPSPTCRSRSSVPDTPRVQVSRG